jgi:capsid protein
MKSLNADADQDVAIDRTGQQLADNVAVTTNKSTYNMPQGSKMESIEAKQEGTFSDFYMPNVYMACAAIGIPPEVALSKYDSNFSASRAALKDWEHTIKVDRSEFSFQFYKPIFGYWFDLQVLSLNIMAPGYLNAFLAKDQMTMDAYKSGRFIGANVPHIDPLKEVEAERAKLGPLADHLPLTTVEKSTEILNGGDSENNIKKFAQELKEGGNNGLELETNSENPNKK